MIAGQKSRTALAFAFCAVGIAAAWFVYQELLTPDGARRAVAVAGKQPAADGALPVAREFKLPPLSTFEATLRRPVFSQSRRPKAGAPVVVTQDLALKMLGVTGFDGEKRALLVPEGGGETLQLRVGEEYLGWTLREIGDSHLIFNRDDQEVRLEVDFKEAPKPVRRRPGQPGLRQPAGAQGPQDNLRQNQLRQQQQTRQQQLQQRQQQLQQQQQLQEQLQMQGQGELQDNLQNQ